MQETIHPLRSSSFINSVYNVGHRLREFVREELLANGVGNKTLDSNRTYYNSSILNGISESFCVPRKKEDEIARIAKVSTAK